MKEIKYMKIVVHIVHATLYTKRKIKSENLQRNWQGCQDVLKIQSFQNHL